MNRVDGVYINGRWQRSTGSATFPVVNPFTEEVVGTGTIATPEDVDRAVQSAHHALHDGPWRSTPLEERVSICRSIAAKLSQRTDELARLASLQMGAPFTYTKSFCLGTAVELIDAYAEAVQRVRFEYLRMDRFGNTLIRRRPVGVVAGIVPWNSPVRSEIKKIIPALLAGCPIVLKPAPETPFGAAIVAEICSESGAPPGVVNLVPGDATTGEALISHPLVRKIAFTGSSAVGAHVGGVAAADFKRTQLELGGKSAAVVMDDADIDATVPWLVRGIFSNAGQACVATSRILAHRSKYRDVVDAMSARANAQVLGDPFDAATTMGPLVARRQQDRVLRYIARGRAEGAKVAAGGHRPEDLPHGWFVRPTVFSGVDNSMTIAREEIFGPVASVIPFDTVEEAIGLANDSDYGLGGAVYSADPHRALAVAERIDSGYISINQFGIGASGPFGGVKRSGINREQSVESFDSFLEYIPHPVSAEFAKELAATIPVE